MPDDSTATAPAASEGASAAAATALERADALAACTEDPARLTRRFATPALAQAGDLVLGWMRDAGRYDGMLGVLVALAVVESVRERSGPPFALEVLGFADEEGVRYGIAYLGSSVVAGTFDRSALDRRDADGIAMADALAAFGGDPAAL